MPQDLGLEYFERLPSGFFKTLQKSKENIEQAEPIINCSGSKSNQLAHSSDLEDSFVSQQLDEFSLFKKSFSYNYNNTQNDGSAAATDSLTTTTDLAAASEENLENS